MPRTLTGKRKEKGSDDDPTTLRRQHADGRLLLCASQLGHNHLREAVMIARASRGSALLIGMALLMSTGCGAGMETATAAGRAARPEGAVYVNVTNFSGGPMDIYAAGTGTSYRVGTVLPGLSSRFEVRPTMTVNGAVELIARSGQRQFFRSGPVLLRPGSVVDFRIDESPVLTTATIRP
jgi:hypothetical protein